MAAWIFLRISSLLPCSFTICPVTFGSTSSQTPAFFSFFCCHGPRLTDMRYMDMTVNQSIKFINKSAIIQCFWLHTIHRNMTVWVHKMPLQGRGCLIKCTTSGDPDRQYGLLGVPTGCTHTNQTKVKSKDP